MKEIMMIEKKIKKYVVVIICVLSMITLGKKTENIFASDKKSKDMENSLLSFYIKNVSNVESIKYIPLDKKIIGNKSIGFFLLFRKSRITSIPEYEL